MKIKLETKKRKKKPVPSVSSSWINHLKGSRGPRNSSKKILIKQSELSSIMALTLNELEAPIPIQNGDVSEVRNFMLILYYLIKRKSRIWGTNEIQFSHHGV